MRLLICTQRVDKNDGVLGFFHRWLIEFAKHFDHVTVIALWVGTYDLPRNVTVYSLGKEEGNGMMGYIGRFFPLLWKLRNEYDTVFVHMSVEFAILGGVVWKLSGKRIVLWYTHRQNSLRVRIGAFFADRILSAASQSFPFATPKLRVIGHGIDTTLFDFPPLPQMPESLTLLTVGRITRIKNDDTLLSAIALLRDRNIPVSAIFLGAPVTPDDHVYEKELQEQIARTNLSDIVIFPGNVPNTETPKWYGKVQIVVNMTPTGGIDKTVLEAMASGRITVVSNTAFREHFGPHADMLIFRERDPEDLARKIESLYRGDATATLSEYLHTYARTHFDVVPIVKTISDNLKNQ